jgi:CRP-like cAMP-binding protein
MPHGSNFLLSRLSPATLARVAPHLSVVELVASQVLAETHQLLIKYEQFFLSQVQQTAACNAVHDIEARTCRWLARMYDLVGPELPLTQEFFARMMGVQRSSLTTVASLLQTAGLISSGRGRIRIVDIEKIRQRACECDDVVRSHYRRMFPLVEAGLEDDRRG